MVCTWSQEDRKQHHCGAVAVWLVSLEGAPPVTCRLANDSSAGVRPAFASLSIDRLARAPTSFHSRGSTPEQMLRHEPQLYHRLSAQALKVGAFAVVSENYESANNAFGSGRRHWANISWIHC